MREQRTIVTDYFGIELLVGDCFIGCAKISNAEFVAMAQTENVFLGRFDDADVLDMLKEYITIPKVAESQTITNDDHVLLVRVNDKGFFAFSHLIISYEGEAEGVFGKELEETPGGESAPTEGEKEIASEETEGGLFRG